MLFELLTGRLPFDADSPLAMAYQHVQETPPAPSGFNRALTPAVDALVARALRKNPAERFPTADAMHDETERVLAATARNTVPLLSGESGSGNRGEGVAAAVFPSAQGPVQTPPPQLQTPYAPTPTPQSGYGPSTPPPSAYGYPQQGGAQAPPPSSPYGYPQQGSAPTPPPMPSMPQQHLSGGPGGPGGPGGGRKRNMPLILGASVAAVAVVVIISVVVAMSGGGKGDPNADDTSTPAPTAPSTTAAPTPTQADVVMGDQSRTIESSECTKAHNDLINPGKPNIMTMPDFTSIYVDSAVACMKAANWPYEIKDMDEQQWGKGTITAQTPKSLEDFDIHSGQKITIWVSTGKGAS
jgi:hypothetical protein